MYKLQFQLHGQDLGDSSTANDRMHRQPWLFFHEQTCEVWFTKSQVPHSS